MKLKRIFKEEQKEFSKIDNKDDLIEFDILSRVPLEIMKTIEMWRFNRGSYVTHWCLEKIVDDTIKPSLKIITPVTLLIGCEKDKTSIFAVLGVNRGKKILNQFSTPEDFIEAVKRKLLTEKKNNSYKIDSFAAYSKWFNQNGFKTTTEDLLFYYKYIALCLSGQLDPYIVDSPWDEYNEIFRLKVNYAQFVSKDLKIIKSIIAKCMINICGRPEKDCDIENYLLQ